MINIRMPERQPGELRWTIFGIRYRISPTFFLISALFGYLMLGPDPVLIAIDVACIFTALIVTEFVQGLVYRSYGVRSTVLVQDFVGGIYPDDELHSRLQRITAALSSPASCFLLFAAIYYSNQQWNWSGQSPYHAVAYRILYIVSLFWGIIGLIPIFPYPTGRVMAEVFGSVAPHGGLVLTLVISIIIAVAYVAYTVFYMMGWMDRIILAEGVPLPPSILLAVFFGLTIIRNIQMLSLLQAVRSTGVERDDYDDDAPPWERR